MIDPNHPFYEPLWRRIAIPAVCAAWAVGELVMGSLVWAAIVGAVGAYAAYQLLIVRSKPQAQRAPESDEAQS